MSAAYTTTWPQVGKYPTQPLRWPAGLSHLPQPEPVEAEPIPVGEASDSDFSDWLLALEPRA